MVLSSAFPLSSFFSLNSSLKGGLATYLCSLGTSFRFSLSSINPLSLLTNSSVPKNICPFNSSHGDSLSIPSITNFLYFSMVQQSLRNCSISTAQVSLLNQPVQGLGPHSGRETLNGYPSPRGSPYISPEKDAPPVCTFD